MADITFKHVKKVYDKGNVVVPDLNLEIKDKEFIVLVGPSGGSIRWRALHWRPSGK